VAFLDKMDEQFARIEDMLHQLIGLFSEPNSGQMASEPHIDGLEPRSHELEPGLHERIDVLEHRLDGRMANLEQKLDHAVEGIQRDVTVLKSESDHFARKLGTVERDLTVLRNRS
jgi:hypothetical protein